MARNWRSVRVDVAGRLDERAVSDAGKAMLDEVRAYRLAETAGNRGEPGRRTSRT